MVFLGHVYIEVVNSSSQNQFYCVFCVWELGLNIIQHMRLLYKRLVNGLICDETTGSFCLPSRCVSIGKILS